jgi:hypothetical protein
MVVVGQFGRIDTQGHSVSAETCSSNTIQQLRLQNVAAYTYTACFCKSVIGRPSYMFSKTPLNVSPSCDRSIARIMGFSCR